MPNHDNHNALVKACQALCFAYTQGDPDDPINWNDLDRAYTLARTALAQAGEHVPEANTSDPETDNRSSLTHHE
jgi:hypothetical protein